MLGFCNLILTGPSGAFRLQSVNGVENYLMPLYIWGGGHNGLTYCGDWYADIYSLIFHQTDLFLHNLHSAHLFALHSVLVWAVKGLMLESKQD